MVSSVNINPDLNNNRESNINNHRLN
jgi:hypothetical protein